MNYQRHKEIPRGAWVFLSALPESLRTDEALSEYLRNCGVACPVEYCSVIENFQKPGEFIALVSLPDASVAAMLAEKLFRGKYPAGGRPPIIHAHRPNQKYMRVHPTPKVVDGGTF